jgi:subtilisin
LPGRRAFVVLLCSLSLVLPAAAAADTEPIPDQYIVVLKRGADLNAAVAGVSGLAGVHVIHVYGHALNGYAAQLPAPALAVVQADPRTDYVVQDRRGELASGKGKPPPPPPPPPPWNTPQTLPTGINRMDGDLSSQRSGDQAGSLAGPPVAIVDTGIDTAHPDLNVAGGVNCVGALSSANDGTINDANGHGTHVSGIVGAKDDLYGVAGVAPGVPLYSVRTLDANGSGTSSGQICGVDWVTANAAALGIKVANFSQVSALPKTDDGNCGNTNSDPLHQAICNSTAAGVLWVVGMANSALDISTNTAAQAPMGYDEVLSVTAVADGDGVPGGAGSAAITCRAGEVDDQYATFSDWVSSPADQAHTVAEPGVCINSTWKGSTYSLQSGTSMSTPHATGVAELCFAAGACAGTPAETLRQLVAAAAADNQANPSIGYTGDPQHAPVGNRYYGYLLRANGF